MPSHTIMLSDTSTGVKCNQTFDLEDHEEKMLKAYLQYSTELAQVEIVRRGGVECGLTVTANETGLSYATQIPEDREICHLLFRLRPLILTNEHASYDRVTGILGKQIDHQGIRDFLKGQRMVYDGRAMGHLIQIRARDVHEEVLINSDKMLNDWLNSHEYHRDQGKKEELERFHQILPVPASKPIFLMLISDKVKAIQNVAQLVSVILGEHTTCTIHVSSPQTSMD